MKKLILFLFLILSVSSCKQPYGTYYIDSESGSDEYAGTSSQRPWKTLAPANRHVFGPNEKLLLKAGSVFFGQLELRGNGTEGAPVIVDTYGEGEKPVIHGMGEKEYTLLLENVSFWEVCNLEITNRGEQDVPRRRGVLVRAFNSGDCRHIYLKQLTVHDVNGSLFKAKGGGTGIYWQNGGDSIPTRFIDLRIENCRIYDCQRDGITSWGNVDRDKWHPSLNVVIRGNRIERVPGDGIVPIGCDGALVERNCVLDGTDLLHINDAAAGIWPWSSDNTVIQYNEVGGHSAKWDGQGFDSDYNCRNTLIQYNYSHDNAGGFLLVCNDGGSLGKGYNIGTENTVVRYNISINDGLRGYPTRSGWFSPTIHISGPAKNTKIYNNLFIIKEKPVEETDRTIVKVDNWGGPWPDDVFFANNIFYVADEAHKYRFDLASGTNFRFVNNLFYGNFSQLPDDPQAVFADPLFTFIPQTRGKAFEHVMEGIMLQSSSPCKENGIDIPDCKLPDLENAYPDSLRVSIGPYPLRRIR